MAVQLFKHNFIAYQSAMSMLDRCGKAAIVHPTGTGKSFIAFQLCADHPTQTVCWLAPSEYIFRTQLENLVNAGGTLPENIRFFTYARMMNMTNEEMSEIQPDYIILDEFHRCGAEMWGAGVQNLLNLYEKVPVLGLSATAIRYLDNQRNMADELFDGNIASEMTLGEAIVRGILSAPVYIVGMYSYQKDLEKYAQRVQNERNRELKRKAQQYLDALKRTLEMADGIDAIFRKHIKNKSGKYIVFCSNYEHMQEMIAHVPEWFRHADTEPHIYKAYAENPDTDRAFADFKEDSSDHLKLLFCIDMLNEGIHVSDISGVILLRPTTSPIIYKQQIGRALSASKLTEPYIFDLVDNIDSLYSISEVQEEMQTAINYYRSHGESAVVVNEQFQLLDEVRDCIALFEKMNETLRVSWEKMYLCAKAYYEEHGDLLVPQRYKTEDGYSLGAWLSIMRSARKGSRSDRSLTQEQIELLDAIGMRWENKSDYQWSVYYDELVKYKERFGNIDLSHQYKTESGIALGKWLVRLRTYQSAGVQSSYLTEERIQQLNDLGMIWDKVNYLWERNYQALLQYYHAHGNVEMGRKYKTEDGLALGMWLYNIQNRYCRNGDESISADQKQRLEALGVSFVRQTPTEQEWYQKYQQAKKFYEENGHLDVPYYYVTDDKFHLGYWIHRHRSNEKGKSQIQVTEERRRLLNEIGMIWERSPSTEEENWQSYYQIAADYYQKHGNLDLKASQKYQNAALGNWLVRQRGAYHKGELSKERVELLNQLQFQWLTAKEQLWQKQYEDAKRFYAENGHLDVPYRMGTLNRWILSQRKKYRDNELPEEYIDLLNQIGMVWDVDNWQNGYEEAEKYYRTFGNLDIPAQYVTESGYRLGSWYRSQRNAYRDGTLSDNRKSLLEQIGIQWESIIVRNWMQYYELAKDYYENHGDLRVHSKYKTENGIRLGTWISSQREFYRDGKLQEEQIMLLENIGMEWNRFNSLWENGFEYAQKYRVLNHSLDVSFDYVTEDGFKLGAWINTQRNKYRSGKLTSEQIQRLESLGMIWNPHEMLWNTGYQKAKEYLETQEKIPSGLILPDGYRLGQWVRNQQNKLKEQKLDERKVRLLSEIGIRADVAVV